MVFKKSKPLSIDIVTDIKTGMKLLKENVLIQEKNVSFFDLSPFVKFDISGRYAHEELQRLCSNNIKNSKGKTTYTQMLNQSGGIEADITISCLRENYFRIICPALARSHNKSHILKNIKKKIRFNDVTDDLNCIGIFGPNSRIFLTEIFGNFFLKKNFLLQRVNFSLFLIIKFGFKDYLLLVNLVGKYIYQKKLQIKFLILLEKLVKNII